MNGPRPRRAAAPVPPLLRRLRSSQMLERWPWQQASDGSGILTPEECLAASVLAAEQIAQHLYFRFGFCQLIKEINEQAVEDIAEELIRDTYFAITDQLTSAAMRSPGQTNQAGGAL